VAQGEAEDFTKPNPQARLVPFVPSAHPQLRTERFNAAPVMPPAEVEQLAFDLLADLAPADARPESTAAPAQMTSVVIEFCHDWRSLWSLYGESREGRAEYEQLLGATRRRIAALPPVRVASTGYNAQAVLNARIFAHLFGDGGGARREAVEFNAPQPSHTETVTLEVPQVELPTVEVPRIETTARMPQPPIEPVLERPIIILSAPRAGSTLLFETLAQAEGIYTIGGESHQLIESIAALRPGRGFVSSNRLTRRDATTEIVAELRRRFTGRIHDRDGQPPASGARARLLEKTPKNALRVPFLLEVFPDAQFIFLQREPRANLSSMMEAWRAKGWVTYRQLPGWPGPWSLLLPPGYERLKGRPLEEIVAFQWRIANETILDDLADLPRERWTTTRYEALIADPRAEIARLLEFIGLAMDARLEAHLSKPLPPSRYTQTRPDPEKWRKNAAEIERVLPGLSAVNERLSRQAGG
jgi:LPS sulfotransferase NodH